MTNPIGQAIEALEVERAHLVARLGKVDTALTTLRELFHLPDARKHVEAAPPTTDAPKRQYTKRRGRPPKSPPDDPEHESRALLTRIAACEGPPAATFEGQLHRRVRQPASEPPKGIGPLHAEAREELETVWNGGEGLSACGSVPTERNH